MAKNRFQRQAFSRGGCSVPDTQPSTIKPELNYEWVFHVQPGPAPIVSVRDANVVNQPRTSRRKIGPIEPWPADLVTITPGAVDVSGLSGLGGILLIHLEVLTGSQVTVANGTSTAFSLPVVAAMTLHNGVPSTFQTAQLSTPMAGMMELLHEPGAASEPIPGVRKFAGFYLASTRALASHILTFSPPAAPALLTPTRPPTWLSLEIYVDESGSGKARLEPWAQACTIRPLSRHASRQCMGGNSRHTLSTER
jgi:hypothetical protein